MHLNKRYFNTYLKDNYGKNGDANNRGNQGSKLDIEFEDDDSFWINTKING